jgi:hypothetical protein
MDNQYHPRPQRRLMHDGWFSFKSKIEGVGTYWASSSSIIYHLRRFDKRETSNKT